MKITIYINARNNSTRLPAGLLPYKQAKQSKFELLPTKAFGSKHNQYSAFVQCKRCIFIDEVTHLTYFNIHKNLNYRKAKVTRVIQ